MYIKVKVTANAKSESCEKIAPDAFKISVKEKAEMGRANNKVKEILIKEMGLSGKDVRLISGHTSPSKIFSIRD